MIAKNGFPNQVNPFSLFTQERASALVMAIAATLAEFGIIAAFKSHSFKKRKAISDQIRILLVANIERFLGNGKGVKIRFNNNGFFVILDDLVVFHLKQFKHPEELLRIPKTLTQVSIPFAINLTFPGMEDIAEEKPLSEYYDLIVKYGRNEASLIDRLFICDQRDGTIINQIEIPLDRASAIWEAKPEPDAPSGEGIQFELDESEDDIGDDNDMELGTKLA